MWRMATGLDNADLEDVKAQHEIFVIEIIA